MYLECTDVDGTVFTNPSSNPYEFVVNGMQTSTVQITVPLTVEPGTGTCYAIVDGSNVGDYAPNVAAMAIFDITIVNPKVTLNIADGSTVSDTKHAVL